MRDQTPYRSVPYGMRTRRRRGSFLGRWSADFRPRRAPIVRR